MSAQSTNNPRLAAKGRQPPGTPEELDRTRVPPLISSGARVGSRAGGARAASAGIMLTPCGITSAVSPAQTATLNQHLAVATAAQLELQAEPGRGLSVEPGRGLSVEVGGGASGGGRQAVDRRGTGAPPVVWCLRALPSPHSRVGRHSAQPLPRCRPRWRRRTAGASAHDPGVATAGWLTAGAAHARR